MLRALLATKTREQLLSASQEEAGGHGGPGGLARTLRTLDLLAIGVGSTVGTGVFSITGQVARTQAGPAVILCWLLGGFGCSLSAVSYIELSARLPVTGSVYAFAYNVLGEVFAVVAASCITLEYGISASAVAANWGEKFRTLLSSFGAPRLAAHLSVQLGPVELSAPALLLLLAVTALVAVGGALGKIITRGSSTLAVLLILSMFCIAIGDFEASNFSPFVPPELGMGGVLAGTVTTFFGFLGYDEVCCLAGEAVNPRKSIPRSVLGTISLATLLPVLGSVGLVGLMPYSQIDKNSGFEVAFRQKDWLVLSHAVSVGELIVLFVVTYMCFLAQPRVFYALAKDGLMPSAFLDLDGSGNPRFSVYATGVLLILCGALLPFDLLANAISGGVLVAFNLVNCCTILLRHRDASGGGGTDARGLLQGGGGRAGAEPVGGALATYVVFSAVAAIAAAHSQGAWPGVTAAALALLVALVALGLVAVRLRRCTASGHGRAPPSSLTDAGDAASEVFFRVPCVPWVPALAIAFNNVMLASLNATDFALLAGYLVAVLAIYLAVACRRGSRGSQECELGQGEGRG